MSEGEGMKRRLHFKPGLQESIRQNQRGLDHYAALSGKPRIDIGAKEKVVRGPVNHAESEAPVLKAVGQLLAVHPNIAIAIRINSGLAYDQRDAPVRFHMLVRGDGVCVDYVGAMRDGRPFALECKRPDWSGVSRANHKGAIREQRQEEYINVVRAIGGVGGFVRSVDEAIEVIRGYVGS